MKSILYVKGNDNSSNIKIAEPHKILESGYEV